MKVKKISKGQYEITHKGLNVEVFKDYSEPQLDWKVSVKNSTGGYFVLYASDTLREVKKDILDGKLSEWELPVNITH